MAKNGDSRSATRVAANDYAEILACRDYRSPYPVVAGSHELKRTDVRAAFAMQCIERWAMVAGQPDGEDSAGRAKLRRMTPSEVTQHACECTELAFAEFARRGWVMDVPPLADLIDKIKDAENTNN